MRHIGTYYVLDTELIIVINGAYLHDDDVLIKLDIYCSSQIIFSSICKGYEA